MHKPSLIPALAASVGIALAIATISAINLSVPSPLEPTATPTIGTAALPGPAGWQHYRCTFVWTAPATNVYPSVSQDGKTWQPCGIAPHPATTGTNTIYLLLPATLLADSPAPRLRIGTADRLYGFETALPNHPQQEDR